jgi:hypothetical protein
MQDSTFGRIVRILLVSFTLATPAAADVIGLPVAVPLPAITQNSRITFSTSNATVLNVVGNPASSTDPLLGGSAFAEISDVTDSGGGTRKQYRGRIDTVGTPAGSVVQSGSFWRDELFFHNDSGSPGSLQFVFSIHYDLTLQAGGSASFMYGADNTWHFNLDPINTPQIIFSENLEPLAAGTHTLMAAIATNDFDATRLLGSDTYSPVSFGFHGRAFNALLDWSHTIELLAVNAFDGSGNPLAPGTFDVSFVSGLTVPPPSTSVPEPGAFALFSLAAAIGAWRSRLASRVACVRQK